MRRRGSWGIFILALGLAAGAWAAQRFPPPDFEGGHQLPASTEPPARALVAEYADAAVLLAALALSSWLVLHKRSRRGVVWLSVFSLLYFGFYRKGCICAIGSIQNVALALANPAYAIPATVVVFFLAPLLAALFFGRTFCAAVCPHGAIQDLMLLRPVKVPDWLDQSLRLLAYVYLGLGVLFAVLGAGFIICQFDPFVPIFRRTGSWPMVLAGAAFLVIGIFVGRPYCRYLCPYGVLLGLASCVSKWRVRITPADCVQCRLCEESCPVGAIHKSSLPQPPAQRAADKRRVAAALALLPLIIAATAWVGGHLGATLARKHLTVSLAERVYLEESGRVEGTTDYSAKFRDTGRAVAALYDEARGVESRFSTGGAWFGVWVGLVIGLKLVSFSMGRRRTDYEADQVACVACARCYNFCPEEHVRLVQVGAMPLPAAQPASQKG